MLYTSLARQSRLQRVRQLHSTFIKNENKSVSETSKTHESSKPPVERVSESIIGSPLHNVSYLDKRILVWVKRYPSVDQVPQQVTIDCIRRAHTMVRIRLSFIIMGFAIIGFIGSAMIGKRDVASGKNIYTERSKWYKEVQDKAKKEAESAGKD